MAKSKVKCPKCRKKLIDVASNYKACSNLDCDYSHNTSSKNSLYFPYFIFEDSRNHDFYQFNDIHDYKEEYDQLLFFSNHQDYLTRYEYREETDFIEESLFENNKKKKFKRFLNDVNVDERIIENKYRFINEGRQLEDKNPKEAFEYYKSIKNNNLFKNDYYIHKKLVKLCDDYDEQLSLIINFFKSGIYCNRYHYLWFLKKLWIIKKNIGVSDDIINDCLSFYKKYGFNHKEHENYPCYLAEKISKSGGILKILTDEEYVYKQFKFELSEESSQLTLLKEYDYVIDINKSLIFDYGFKSMKFFQKICANYHRKHDFDNERKWLYIYQNSGNTIYSDNHWFKSKLNKVVNNPSDFIHGSFFFDKNEYYLNESDFESNEYCELKLENHLDLIKEKCLLIKKAKSLERYSKRAISFYSSLLKNELFKNDYYVYKKLVLLYDKFEEFEKELDIICSFFEAEIYCDRYNYLFFIDHFKKLYHLGLIEYDEVDYYLEFFKNHGFKNPKYDNDFIPIAEKLVFKNNKIDIITEEEFSQNKLISSLKLEINIYEQYFMLNHANKIYKTLIDDYYDTPFEYYMIMCDNYREINDYENEMKCINEFIENVSNMHFDEKYQFLKRLDELKEIINKNPTQNIIKDDEMEIFFENNSNYLTYDDFKNSAVKNFGLIDQIMIKYSVLNKGRKLENDYEQAINFYKPFLNDALFNNDYFIYRRLVILYSKFGEYNLAYDTIKDFFYSGINCNRYQYMWFLHKLENISKFRNVSYDEISNMLSYFKENGFKNNHLIVHTDRLKRFKGSVEVISLEEYEKVQKEYEFKEEISQLDINGRRDQSAKTLRKLIEMNSFNPPRYYMRLCHCYREIGEYENEKELIEEYLSKYGYAKSWFKKRLDELNELIK